jgi:peptidoglycan hydrolase-like protein with peptidoglycan-binding domain
VPDAVRRRLRVRNALAAAVVFLPILAPAAAQADHATKYKPALTSSSSGGASMDRYHHLGARPLSRNLKGHDVRVAQDYLRRAGFHLTIDGTYGPDTIKAVKVFERANALHVDGNLSLTDISFLRGFVERGGTMARVRGVKATAPTGETAGLNSDGTATAPQGAPPEVAAIIAAANKIATLPYRYGGGHGKWEDSAYDCSGSVSYALHGANLLDHPMASGDLESWGQSGPGQWVTVYANGGHAYMVVAGLRFDTSGRSSNGTRWQADMRSPSGYVIRHPPGL